MKTNLEQAMMAKSLRHDIFNTFRNKSLHQFTHLLHRSRERESRYFPYNSQHTLIKSQVDSPNPRTISSNRLQPSPPLRTRSQLYQHHTPHNKLEQLQRSKKKVKNNQGKSRKKSQNKQMAKSQLMSSNKKMKKPSSKMKKTEKSESREKKKYHSKEYKSNERLSSSKSKSKSKSSRNKEHKASKLNLSSIIEQYSSEEKIITPSSKITRRKQSKKHQSSIDKTYKKEHQESLSDNMKKKLDKLYRSPQRFITLKRLNCLSVRLKIERRKIIQVQINVLSNLQELKIYLDKGNLECQHIQEHYNKLHASERINLLSSVREINLDEPFKLPKLVLSYLEPEQTHFTQKTVVLPYTWLHLTSDPQKHTKSRVKTKACLQNVVITPSNMRALSLILPTWSSSISKNEMSYVSAFVVGECQYQLCVSSTRSVWRMQLSGRKEQRLYKLLYFLYELLW